MSLQFWVDGTPQPQGSKTGYVVGGRAVVVDKNPKQLKPWRRQIADTATEVMAGYDPLIGAVAVSLEFVFVRPKTVKRERPTVRPDLDKLVRAVLDGLTTAGVYGDDAQVTQLTASKRYGATAGVSVVVDLVNNNNEMGMQS